jgi:hypothetical protein
MKVVCSQWETRVEAGSNASTVTLRVVGGDEKGSLKLWSRVPRDSDPSKTALGRASSIYERHTRTLIREGASQKQDRNCQRLINIWSWAPDEARQEDYWLTDRQSYCDFSFDFAVSRRTRGRMESDLGGQDWFRAVIIDCNCKDVSINPIIRSRTHYY